MYYYIVNALKRRLVTELQNSFAQHPTYNKVVPYIQNKYSFKERPQFGIVIKGSSANKVQLSGDNFLGIIYSHVGLCFYGKPCYPIEWVREDLAAVNANQGQFPLHAGVYYIEIMTVPTNASEYGTFMVDPLLTVTQEPVLKFTSGVETEGQLQNPPVKGTLRLYENGHYELTEGREYTVDYATGAVNFILSFAPGSRVTANYRFAVPSMGPFNFAWNTADMATLPGVVLAFGSRACEGDKIAVVITGDRVATARAYGGKWEVSFEIDVMAQDPHQMEQMADLFLMYWWADKKPILENEGIETVDINMGGESEEPMDETGDIYMYTASMSLQLRADWELHLPIPFTISGAFTTLPGSGYGTTGTLGPIPEPTDQMPLGGQATSLIYATLPIFAGRNNNFERIK